MIALPSGAPLRAVLFDFDGTLADTAPDLAGAVNRMRERRGLAPLPLAELRPWASAGARGLIGAAFGMAPSDPGYEPMRREFLDLYEAAICVDTVLFDGMADVLALLESRGIAWGIVTNKMARLTQAIVGLMRLDQRAGTIVSGDTTLHAKPHPAPLLHAAQALGVPAHGCWYVGDDERDIVAGRAAGMGSIAAGWGYCGHSSPAQWGADQIIDSPQALLAALQGA